MPLMRPSGAHRAVECYGSVQAESRYPDMETEEAKAGTASHWVFAEMFKNQVVKPGMVAENGVVLNDEHIEGAEVFYDDVMKIINDTPLEERQHLYLHVEQPVNIPRIGDGYKGTPDVWIWNAYKRKLYIIDYKFGHSAIEAFENWQLISYFAGIIDLIFNGHCNGMDDQKVKVEFRIVQPRAWHLDGIVRSHEVTASNLRAQVNRLKTTWMETQKPNPKLNAGPWCKNCKASADCDKLRAANANVMDHVQTLSLHKLNPVETGVQLDYLERALTMMNEQYDSLKTQAQEQIKQGVVIPGYGTGYGRGSTKWNKSDAEVIALGDLMGVDLRKPDKPITPKQALKLKLDETVIKSYSKNYQGAACLVKDSKTVAGRIFGKK